MAVKKRYLLAGLFTLLLILPVAAFYIRYEIIVSHMKNDLGYDGAKANAVKHALAAAELYGVLRTIVGPVQAEHTTLTLGAINEYIERVTKLPKPDSPREVMKDMFNNLAGVTAKEWQIESSISQSTLQILLMLAERGVLVISRDDNPFYTGQPRPLDPVVKTALAWLNECKSQIKSKIRADLLGWPQMEHGKQNAI